MLRVTCNIEIGKYKFTKVNAIEIDSSWENLTDTCKITMPRLTYFGTQKLTDIIRRGDKVTVQIGYDDADVKVFEGYVRDVSGQIPIVINCEDAMFLLKKGSIKKSWRSITTAALIKEIIGNTMPYEVLANITNLGKFAINDATPSQVLEKLRSTYFVKSWCRNGKLYVGLAYVPQLQKRHIFDFNQNIIENNLEFKQKEDVRLSLVGKIVYSNNKKEEVKIGDSDGEQRTFNYKDKSKSEVEQLLKAEMERLKYTGFRGSFTAFGTPTVNHGDVVLLKDKLYPEREGQYLVKKVNTQFGVNGFRQVIELEAKFK
jgi:hypothetical protein